MISVAIPCYKSDLLMLKQAINSVLMQSDPRWELILVDGNENEDCRILQLLDSLNDTRVRYIRNDADRSMAGNWNLAYSSAQAELVTLLHDDDILCESYITDMIELSKQHPNSAAYFCNVNIIGRNGKKIFNFSDSVKKIFEPKHNLLKIKGEQGIYALLQGCFIFCPTLCYRKSKLPEYPFDTDYKMVTDLKFYYDTVKSGGELTGIKRQLYAYRRHDENQTAKLTRSFIRFDEEIALYDFIESDLPDNWNRAARAAKRKTIIKLHLFYLVIVNTVKLRFSKALNCINYIRNSL